MAKFTGLLFFATVLGIGILTFQNCGYFTSYHVTPGTNDLSLSSLAGGYLVRTGEFQLTDFGTANAASVGGRVLQVVSGTGTKLNAFVYGLQPSTMYMAHLHNLPCSLGGGGHYKHDTSIVAASETNEMWLHLTSDATGVASAAADSALVVRPDAQSIVIHDPAVATNRIACADLTAERKAVIKGGTFKPTDAGTTLGIAATGNGTILRNATSVGQTIVRFSVAGLTANTSYMAHVHNLPCANTVGGPHYKRNNAVVEAAASAANELWPLFTTDANGQQLVQLAVDGHVARDDAASIIIHYPPDATQRISCMDLASDAGFVSTPVGLAAGHVISGTASMTRLSSGKTQVDVNIAGGLPPSTMIMAHVHDRPCVTGGGGHYKIDYGITTAVESNEMWFRLASDASGAAAGRVTVDHLARPEAMSIVVHDPVTAANRWACADLY